MVARFGFAREGELELSRLMTLGVVLPTVVSFIEGVVFLCTSDESFARRYNQR